MSREEKPPAGPELHLDSILSAGKPPRSELSTVEPSNGVSADLINRDNTLDRDRPTEVPVASLVETHLAPSIPENLDNISANGGAVGALVLGAWSLMGSFVTSWSILNALLGLMLGFWGLSSRKRRLAWIGIVLCIVSVLLSMVQASEWINQVLESTDENPI